jgi:hypothetical protein
MISPINPGIGDRNRGQPTLFENNVGWPRFPRPFDYLGGFPGRLQPFQRSGLGVPAEHILGSELEPYAAITCARLHISFPGDWAWRRLFSTTARFWTACA